MQNYEQCEESYDSDKNGCINLGIGIPSVKNLPTETFNSALHTLSYQNKSSFLQYGKIRGGDDFIKSLAKFLSSQYNLDVCPTSLVASNGVTGGLSLLLSLFSVTGSTIFCENPTYSMALEIFSDYKLNVKPISIDSDGLVVSELNDMIKNEGPDKNVFLYTIPIHHNPTGYCMSKNRVKELTKIADNYPNLIVLADEIYQMLSFNPLQQYTPLCYAHKQFISLGSFSKIFCPAVRLGWIQTMNDDFMNKILNCGQLQSGGCVNPIGCAIIQYVLRHGPQTMSKIVSDWKLILVNNAKELSTQLVRHVGEYIESMDLPTGGYFLWVKFKPQISVIGLAENMKKYGIIFDIGEKFLSDSDKKCNYNYIRLSFSWYDCKYEFKNYEEAAIRLKKLIESLK